MKNAEILNTLQRLHRISKIPPDRTHLRKAVSDALASISDSEDLARMALLARYMTTGRAEDERVDAVYWDAFWSCAERLS